MQIKQPKLLTYLSKKFKSKPNEDFYFEGLFFIGKIIFNALSNKTLPPRCHLCFFHSASTFSINLTFIALIKFNIIALAWLKSVYHTNIVCQQNKKQ